MIPFPFNVCPHLQVTSRYSNSKRPLNELVFSHIFEPWQNATRKVRQLCRIAAAKLVKGRGGVTLLQDPLEDPVIVVTKKLGGPQGIWTLKRDITVRFPSARSANHAYEQQRGHNYKDKDTSRLPTHNGYISHVIIATWHMGEELDDPTLHKIFISCSHFNGKDNGALHVLLQDSLTKQ